MSFAQDEGYLPETFEELIEALRLEINDKFNTNFTEENFDGSGWYKFIYGPTQKIQELKVKASEIFLKAQEYYALTNQSLRPVNLLSALGDEGFDAAAKRTFLDPGKVLICVDLDSEAEDFDEKKLQVATIMAEFVAGYHTEGNAAQDVVLSNGQTINIQFSLPDPTPVILRATAHKSSNSTYAVPSDQELRQLIFDNIEERYQFGFNFEPQRYLNLADAPWADTVLLEWSDDDGENWHSTVFTADYTDVFTFGLDDISISIT